MRTSSPARTASSITKCGIKSSQDQQKSQKKPKLCPFLIMTRRGVGGGLTALIMWIEPGTAPSESISTFTEGPHVCPGWNGLCFFFPLSLTEERAHTGEFWGGQHFPLARPDHRNRHYIKDVSHRLYPLTLLHLRSLTPPPASGGEARGREAPLAPPRITARPTFFNAFPQQLVCTDVAVLEGVLSTPLLTKPR